METLVVPLAATISILIGMAAAAELAARYMLGPALRVAVVVVIAAWATDLLSQLGHAAVAIGHPGADLWSVLGALLALGSLVLLYLIYAGKVETVAMSLRAAVQPSPSSGAGTTSPSLGPALVQSEGGRTSERTGPMSVSPTTGTCLKCGTSNPAEAAFCRNCGQRIVLAGT